MKEGDIVENKNNRARNVIDFAYRAYGIAKSKRFKPIAFVLGFSIYYEIKYFCSSVMHLAYWNDQNGEETLFGLPIRVTENNRYEISLELEEFTCDFEREFFSKGVENEFNS